MATTLYRRSYTPLSIDNYEFKTGGENDYLQIDVVDDPSRGLGVPGKSMFIENHGGGVGNSKIKFQISEDGYKWSDVMSINNGATEGYSPDDGVRVWMIKIWADVPKTVFSMRITPGNWTDEELAGIGLETVQVSEPLPTAQVQATGGTSSNGELVEIITE